VYIGCLYSTIQNNAKYSRTNKFVGGDLTTKLAKNVKFATALDANLVYIFAETYAQICGLRHAAFVFSYLGYTIDILMYVKLYMTMSMAILTWDSDKIKAMCRYDVIIPFRSRFG